MEGERHANNSDDNLFTARVAWQERAPSQWDSESLIGILKEVGPIRGFYSDICTFLSLQIQASFWPVEDIKRLMGTKEDGILILIWLRFQELRSLIN